MIVRSVIIHWIQNKLLATINSFTDDASGVTTKDKGPSTIVGIITPSIINGIAIVVVCFMAKLVVMTMTIVGIGGLCWC